ncbi:hypothetical protein WG66_014970 [Moniliophthora roreri]|nr:hypothetical protein WG66_014970 [Moniliophthora roreri]
MSYTAFTSPRERGFVLLMNEGPYFLARLGMEAARSQSNAGQAGEPVPHHLAKHLTFELGHRRWRLD